ncbi:MAG: FkbM family methyltransferase [Sphingomonadales bacterium]
MSKRLKTMIRLLGMADGLLFYWKTKTRKFGKIRARRWNTSFFLRPNTTDFSTYQHVFENKQYDIKIPFSPTTIIDGGANIGLSSIYFAIRFPTTSIFAIEPDQQNFYLLEACTKPFKNIKCLQGAIWPKTGYVQIIDEEADKNSFQVKWTEQIEEKSIPAISMGSLLKKYNLPTLDIVKLDVEGAEKEIFSANVDEWLPFTRILIIELHDNMRPGCSRSVFNAIINYEFRCEISWENLVFYNTRFNV